jgi:hypothetical protein
MILVTVDGITSHEGTEICGGERYVRHVRLTEAKWCSRPGYVGGQVVLEAG